MDLLEVGKLYGSRISYHGNILLKTSGTKNQWEGGEAEIKSLIMQGEGRGRDRKPNFVAFSARIVRGLVVVA